MEILQALTRIESYGFECEAGPLENCQDWIKLKTALTSPSEAYGGWIAASERLPEPSTPLELKWVIVWFRGAAEKGYYIGSIKQWRVLGSPSDWTHAIKHWMPLPSAPSGE